MSEFWHDYGFIAISMKWVNFWYDNHWFPKKLWFLQKVTSWSEKNGKKPIFHHFGRPKITTFWPRIFLMKFLFPANKTAFTTKFSPCPVILSSFWAVFRFVHWAMAIYWRHFFNLVFGAKIRPKCILGNKWCHRQRHALLPNLYIFIKPKFQASSVLQSSKLRKNVLAGPWNCLYPSCKDYFIWRHFKFTHSNLRSKIRIKWVNLLVSFRKLA